MSFRLRGSIKGVAVAAAVALAGSALAGCGGDAAAGAAGSTPAGGDAAKTYTLGVMINDTSNPFLSTMGKAAQEKAASLGMKVELVNGNKDMSTQISAVNDLIAKKVDALAINASDPKAILPAVQAANTANIPVFALNTAMDPSANIVTYVGASDYDMGVAQAKMVGKALSGTGSVAILYGVLGTSPQVQRKKGVEETFAKEFPGIKIVDTCVDEWTTQKNLSCTQDLLTKYPQGQLQGVMAQGPQLYVGAESAHKNGRTDVLFFGMDYHKQVETAIKAGQVFGTIDQSPVLEGEGVAEGAFNWLSGAQDKVQRPNHFIDLPEVTADNVASYPATWSG